MGASPSTARFGEHELLAAKVQLLEAEAEAKRAEAAAARTRAEAEVEAKRAEARTHADAVHAESVRSFLPLAGGAALVALLAVDFYRHESSSFIRRRMLATLRSSRLSQTSTNAAAADARTASCRTTPACVGPSAHNDTWPDGLWQVHAPGVAGPRLRRWSRGHANADGIFAAAAAVIAGAAAGGRELQQSDVAD